MEWTLPARPPFSLGAVIHSHGWIRLAPFVEEPDGPAFGYVGHLATGRVVELRVREAAGGVVVRVAAALTPAERWQIDGWLAWMLGLDQDLGPFYAIARDEPKLAHVEARAAGRLLRSPTLFEDVVKTILTTNTTWGSTIRMVHNLVDQFGEPASGEPTRRAFPTPGRLAASDEETLRAEARLGYRAPYILALARAVDGGDLDLEGLRTSALPTVQLRKELLAIKGVGAYAAAHMLLLLGRYDWIPVDSWALKVVSHEWYGGEPVGPAQVEASFERWGPWKGLAYWFWSWSLLESG